MVDSKKNDFLNFISKIVKNGITSTTYSERADLIINKTNPNIQQLQYNTTLVNCETTISNIVSSMFKEFPTVKEKKICSFNCQLNNHSTKIYLSYQTDNKKINDLQNFLDSCLRSKQTTCGSCKGKQEVMMDISNMHIFIDIFYWEGKYFE